MIYFDVLAIADGRGTHRFNDAVAGGVDFGAGRRRKVYAFVKSSGFVDEVDAPPPTAGSTPKISVGYRLDGGNTAQHLFFRSEERRVGKECGCGRGRVECVRRTH